MNISSNLMKAKFLLTGKSVIAHIFKQNKSCPNSGDYDGSYNDNY